MKRSQSESRLPNQLRLSSRDTHHYISEQLSHLLSNVMDGYRCDRQIVSDMVVKASVTGAAIEGTCNALEDAPTGMTVRSYLNDELSVTGLQEIECEMQTMLKIDLPKRLWKWPLDLAMDLHDEPFYGKDPTLCAYACRGEAYKGTTWFYRVATVYVVHHQIPYTLGIVFVLPEYSMEDLLKALLHQIQGLNLRIRGLYLDKGFCVQPIIDFLKGKPYEVIIACPIRGRTGGTRTLCKGRKSYFTEYTFYAGKPKAYTVPLAVVRTYEQKHGKRCAVWLLYVTLNCAIKNPQTIRARYRSRFGIETSYRCMRQTHAMTTSRNPALRFFLLALAFLILNLWCVLRWRFCQIPRQGRRSIDQKAYELQRHCQFIAQVIDEKYGLLSCILAQVAPLDQ